MRAAAVAALCLFALGGAPARGADSPIDVATAKPGSFIHMEGTGRRSLALSGVSVGLAWEDDRGGAPACHVAVKPAGAAAFREFAMGRGECFEPSISAADAERFLVIWEDEAGVNVALAGRDGVGPATTLATPGGQGSVAYAPGLGAFAAWSAPEGRWRRVRVAPLALDGMALRAGTSQPADAAEPADDQLFPTLAATEKGLALAWEDRRHGHTVIYGSHSDDGRAWSAPKRISGNPTGKANGNLGRGTGAMRPSLAVFGARLGATWLDKRDFLSGYDVYAALSEDGGASFAKDVKAQDSFGDAIAQWHATAAGNRRGGLVLAFDDERDGTPDIWLIRLTPTGWGENFTLPAASGPGRQSDPAIALDEAGNLHLAWIDQDVAGVMRLRYTVLPAAK